MSRAAGEFSRSERGRSSIEPLPPSAWLPPRFGQAKAISVRSSVAFAAVLVHPKQSPPWHLGHPLLPHAQVAATTAASIFTQKGCSTRLPSRCITADPIGSFWRVPRDTPPRSSSQTDRAL